MPRTYRRKVEDLVKATAPVSIPTPDNGTRGPIGESKRERFFRIIEPRVNRCVHDIKLLAYGADRSRYEPTAADIEAMERVLLDAVDEAMGPYKARQFAPSFRFRREC